MGEKYIFVIDTESYSGNFERQMTAYCTGRIGDCEVGDGEASIFRKEVGDPDKIFGEVLDIPDAFGCRRPTEIYPTPGWFNNGMGGHYRDGQEKEALDHHKKECILYSKRVVHPVDQKEHTKRWLGNANKKSIKKCPAYLSVAIFFSKKPTKEQRNLIIKRSKTYAKPRNIKITGFRILKQETVMTEIESFSDSNRRVY